MKKYQKAQMIAKNLPTGSYAAGCPAHTPQVSFGAKRPLPSGPNDYENVPCSACEVAQ